jgi:transposase-like protein
VIEGGVLTLARGHGRRHRSWTGPPDNRWRYLYRAVDQYGQVIDVLLSEQRDTAAARRFFTRALRHGPVPVEVTTDRAGPYLRVLDELGRPQGM